MANARNSLTMRLHTDRSQMSRHREVHAPATATAGSSFDNETSLCNQHRCWCSYVRADRILEKADSGIWAQGAGNIVDPAGDSIIAGNTVRIRVVEQAVRARGRPPERRYRYSTGSADRGQIGKRPQPVECSTLSPACNKDGTPAHRRASQYQRQGLNKIVKFSNFILISTVVEKLNLSKEALGQNAYHIALAHCMETLYEFLVEKEQHHKKTFVVVECRGKKEDAALELEFRRVCDGNNRFGSSLPFDILFSDKKTMSSGLQLADLVARPIGINRLRPDQPNRAFDILRHKFYCEGGRANVGKGYEGVGLKILPSPKSEKPR